LGYGVSDRRDGEKGMDRVAILKRRKKSAR